MAEFIRVLAVVAIVVGVVVLLLRYERSVRAADSMCARVGLYYVGDGLCARAIPLSAAEAIGADTGAF